MSDTFISPEKVKALAQRMKALAISERDLVEIFVRARGRGGQKVNKTSSCVHLKHVPTGIEVKCDKSRSREANRFFARRILADKIEDLASEESSRRAVEIARARKRKATRARKARKKLELKRGSQTEASDAGGPGD